MKTIKKWFKTDTGVTDPLELALLKSIRTEPELWEVVFRDMMLVARHRGRTALITASVPGVAYSDKLLFSAPFATQWYPLVGALYEKRKSDADAVAANATRRQLEKAFGI